jgi:hypothetical protein
MVLNQCVSLSLCYKGMATLEMAAAQVIGARGQVKNWADSGMAVSSPITDTSTDLDTEERINNLVCAISSNFFICSVFTRLKECRFDEALFFRLEEATNEGVWQGWIHLLCQKKEQGIKGYVCTESF